MWIKVLLTVVAVVVLVPVLFVGWVWVSLSGGLDDVVGVDHPVATDPEVVAAERQAREDIPLVVAEVRETMADGAPGLSEIGGGTAKPLCDIGQHNFKIDDDFDLSCTSSAVSVVSAALVSETGATARRVDEALQGDGWRRVTPADFSDGPAGPAGPRVGSVEPGLEPGVEPGVAPGVEPGVAPGSVSGVAPAPAAAPDSVWPLRYTRVTEGRSWQLLVDEADLSSMTYEIRLHDTNGLRDASGRRTTVEQIIARTPREGYAVVMEVSVEYFRD